MRTSSLALVAAGLLGSAGFAFSQAQQSDYSASTQQDRPAPAPTGQESMRQPGSPMSGMPMHKSSPAGRSAQAGDMSAGPDTAQSQFDSDLIQVRQETENGISYMCGGVGIDEASYMKQQAPRYDLMLTFSTRAGNYLADVSVDLKDAKGNTVLKTTCDAPILLVDLPRSGVYHVQAQAGNYNLSKTVSVKAKGPTRQVVMAWTQEPVMPDVPTAGTRIQSVGGSGVESGGGAGRGEEPTRPQGQ